jgi:ribose transport system permease protein
MSNKQQFVEQNYPSRGIRFNRVGKYVVSHYGTVFIFAALVVLFSILTPSFMTTQNWTNILVVQVVAGSLTIGALMPLITGEFDLSLGNSLGFISMVGAFMAGHEFGAGSIIPIMLLTGTIIGMINGILTVFFKISSFIATLGTGIVLSGITLGLSGGQVLFAGIPQLITNIGQRHFWGLAISVWILLLFVIVMFYVLEHTPFGRHLYAIGGNERVAFLAGVRTGMIKIIAFAIAGLFVSIGAIFQLGQAGAATPTFGPEMLLPAYAGVFLGVTTYKPGYYNVIGSVVAILLLAVGFNGLSLLGAPFWVQPVFNGTVLLIAILTARAEARKVKIG